MRFRKFLFLSASVMGAAAAATPSLAQEIEVITVTARQRSEALQTVPVAVTAISEAKLEKTFARDLTALTRVAPNVVVEPVGAINRTAAVIYARGIGYSGIDQAIDPSVGVSVDGLFYPRNLGMLQQMFDSSGIEVNRGPQGTLYGKNTTGGVIKITTKAPEMGVYSLAGYLKMGNYGRSDYGMIANIPFTDTLAFRMAYQSQYSDGFTKNTYVNPVTGLGPTSRDKWLSGDDVKTYRGSLQWEPNDNFTGRLTLTYIKDRSDSAGGQNGSIPANAYGPAFGTTTGVSGDTLALPPNNRIGYGFPGGPTDPFSVERNYPNDDRGDNLYGTLNLSWSAPWFDVESLTGFQRTSQATYADFDNTSASLIESITYKKHRFFQQEVRLISNDEDAPLSWVGGLYYNWYYFYVAQDSSPRRTLEGATQNEWTIAPYFQADYKITPEWTVTGGIRYSSQTKALTRNFEVPYATFGTAANRTRGEREWTAFTYHASTKYQITEDHMVYASYSTGFKSGSFNSRAPSGATLNPVQRQDFLVNPPANPEKATSYEIGAKTQWFDNKLRANVSAFWAEYKDLQVQYFLSVGLSTPQVLANNANERARGVELEIEAIPFENLTLSAAIGYLDARYTNFNANLGNQNFKPRVCNNVAVDHAAAGPCYLVPMRAPQWTMNLTAGYDYHLPNDMGLLTPSVTWGLESTHVTDLNNSAQGIQPTYTVLDGSLTYEDPSERYKLSVWAKNITNTLHKLAAVPSGNVLTQLYFAEPRTFGVQLSFKFSSEDK